METRRMLIALAAASAVFIAYTMIIRAVKPPAPPPTQTAPDFGDPADPRSSSEPATSGPTSASAQTSAPSLGAGPERYVFTHGDSYDPIILGGADDDDLRIEVDPIGGAVSRVFLTDRKENGELRYAEAVRTDKPYELLAPAETLAGTVRSYATRYLWIPEKSAEPWRLDDFPWQVTERGARHVTLETTLRSDAGADLLRVTRSLRLTPDAMLVEMIVQVKNLSDETFRVGLEQLGPIGIPEDSQSYSMRFLMAAHRGESEVQVDRALDRNTLRKGEQTLLSSEATSRFVWAALTNKYFSVFTRPISVNNAAPVAMQKIIGDTPTPEDRQHGERGDLRTRLITEPRTLAPQAEMDCGFEIYAGPKDAKLLAEVNPAFGDRTQVGYVVAKDLDNRCWCWCFNFPVLTVFMTWLLETIHFFVRNYGVAIIILVLIVRTLLHPLTVFQQKSMYRMQDAMSRIQPRLSAIKEKYANDRVKQNQEMMKVYSEENVNPMAPMLGMAPLFIQMPIMISLWTALNTDIHLRHAPFLGWMRDLSAPDALITFSQPFIIPLIGWEVPTFNLLPILMGVSMAIQQKYMPKPGQFAKLEAAKRQAAEQKAPARDGMGMTPEEQVRQQAMIAYMMSVMMPVMLYYFPSGLNLYWMSSNIFGIIESLIIRKQLKAEHERRERGEIPTPKQKPPGMVSKLLKHMATQAEELQRKADELSGQDAKTGRKRRSDDNGGKRS